MEKIRIIFVGTGSEGVQTLEHLAKDERFSIPLVITGEDKKQGRRLVLKKSPIKEVAEKNKLPVQSTEKIEKLNNKIIQIKPDYLLVVSFGEIMSMATLSIPQIASINIHPSLLPLYRGATPIHEPLLHGDKKSGITWIKMNETMDTGNIIEQKMLPILGSDTYITLHSKLSTLAAEKTGDVLSDFAITRKSTPQDATKATYCKKNKKTDGEIHPHEETAEQIVRKIKAYTPWPGCFIFLNGKRVIIEKAELIEQKNDTKMCQHEVCISDDYSILIETKESILKITQLKPEGRSSMSSKDFILGLRLKSGDKIEMKIT